MSERKPMITHFLVSCLAAAALIGFWLANPLESTADTVSDNGNAEAQVATTPPIAEVKVALASADIRATAIPELTTAAPVEVAIVVEAPVAEVPLVEVPDLGKMSIWAARKQLKKQGLRFVFKDGSSRVHHEDFDYYRVRKQSLSAGKRVASGTKVVVQVRERRYASGY